MLPTGNLPIYNRTQLRRTLGAFFNKPSQWRPGDSKVLVGGVRPVQNAGLTYFIVRNGHRVPIKVKYRQKSTPGDRNNIYPRLTYVISYYDYSIYSFEWETEQLSLYVAAYPTLAMATHRLRTIQ